MNIVTKIKSYKIKEINQLLNKMLSSNNLDKRMDYCDELLSELEMISTFQKLKMILKTQQQDNHLVDYFFLCKGF